MEEQREKQKSTFVFPSIYIKNSGKTQKQPINVIIDDLGSLDNRLLVAHFWLAPTGDKRDNSTADTHTVQMCSFIIFHLTFCQRYS